MAETPPIDRLDLLAPLRLTAALFALYPLLFRRNRNRPTRAAAFQAVFSVTSSIVSAAAALKPDWQAQWAERGRGELPPKYALIDESTSVAVRDVRFATALLQRNRWRSVMQPLFQTEGEYEWRAFRQAVAPVSNSLMAAREDFGEVFLQDELDWLDDAIEQFDDAWQQIARGERSEVSEERRIAEGTYQYTYLAIQIAERFIERVRMERAVGDR